MLMTNQSRGRCACSRELVHRPGIYDLEVDTSQLDPVGCADAISALVDDGQPPGGIHKALSDGRAQDAELDAPSGPDMARERSPNKVADDAPAANQAVSQPMNRQYCSGGDV